MESETVLSEPKPKSILDLFRFAYGQYKLDLDYVKNNSKRWQNKPYRLGITHLAIAKHNFYWGVIKKIPNLKSQEDNTGK